MFWISVKFVGKLDKSEFIKEPNLSEVGIVSQK